MLRNLPSRLIDHPLTNPFDRDNPHDLPERLGMTRFEAFVFNSESMDHKLTPEATVKLDAAATAKEPWIERILSNEYKELSYLYLMQVTREDDTPELLLAAANTDLRYDASICVLSTVTLTGRGLNATEPEYFISTEKIEYVLQIAKSMNTVRRDGAFNLVPFLLPILKKELVRRKLEGDLDLDGREFRKAQKNLPSVRALAPAVG